MPMNEDLLYHMIGERIRTARQGRAISQEKLAKKLHMSRASIVNIEAGRQRPPVHVLWQIAEELSTEVALLLPSQDEYTNGDEPVRLDAETVAQIEQVARGDPMARRGLTDFIKKTKGRTMDKLP